MFFSAQGGTRTHKLRKAKDFKSFAYTNSATWAWRPWWDLHPRITVLQTGVLATSPRDQINYFSLFK